MCIQKEGLKNSRQELFIEEFQAFHGHYCYFGLIIQLASSTLPENLSALTWQVCQAPGQSHWAHMTIDTLWNHFLSKVDFCTVVMHFILFFLATNNSGIGSHSNICHFVCCMVQNESTNIKEGKSSTRTTNTTIARFNGILHIQSNLQNLHMFLLRLEKNLSKWS